MREGVSEDLQAEEDAQELEDLDGDGFTLSAETATT